MKTCSYPIAIIYSFLLLVSQYSCNFNTGNSGSQPIKATEKKSKGKIVFDKEIHNFGSLKEGEIVSYSFIFRNVGGSPSKFINADKSCGCIELHYSEVEIAPGESSTVEITLNTSGEWGNVIKEAILETSEGEKKELKIGAYIENKQFNILNTQQ